MLFRSLGVDSDTSDISVVRAHERIVFRDPETGFERQVLSPPHMNNGIEVLLHRIPPGKSSGVLPAYGLPVQKYVVVQEGELLLRMDGKDTTVSAGDTLFFEINAPYRLTNSGRTTCTYYVVMVTRRPAPVAIG